jgi:hypothetical protein
MVNNRARSDRERQLEAQIRSLKETLRQALDRLDSLSADIAKSVTSEPLPTRQFANGEGDPRTAEIAEQ